MQPTVVTSTSLDSPLGILRIDLRDYGWDRPLTVDGDTYADAWQAIAAANPFAVPFDGQFTEQLQLETEPPIPWMSVPSLVDVALRGNLYYALIDVDVAAGFDNWVRDDLGIDVQANRLAGRITRAATSQSFTMQRPLLVERHSVLTRVGGLWQNIPLGIGDNLTIGSTQELPRAAEGIFPLPNGMFGYISVESENRIVANSPSEPVNVLFRATLVGGTADCTGCHAKGLLPLDNEASELIDGELPAMEAERDYLQSVYLSSPDLARQMERDSSRYYEGLGATFVATKTLDPLHRLATHFNSPLSLSQVARELELPVDRLREQLELYPPALAQMAEKRESMSRDTFADIYIASLCAARRDSESRPLASLCSGID